MLTKTRAGNLEFAQSLVRHLAEYNRKPESRPDWTRGNLDALRSFVESRDPTMKSYLSRKHLRASDEKEGEYLTFDYAAYTGKSFLLFAESEFDNRSDWSLKQDFEKLLYVRAPCKVMVCWVRSHEEAQRVAKMLADYAGEVCNEFSDGEVYVLYFANWGSKQEETAFFWQAPGHPPPVCDLQFTFKAMSLN